MRYLCLITLLSLLTFSVPAQEKKDLLINSWAPINVLDINAESFGYGSSLMLSFLSFEESGKVISLYGGTDYSKAFTYKRNHDTLSFSNPELPDFEAVIIKNTETHLKLFLDSMNIVTYIPLPKSNRVLKNRITKNLLTSKLWKLKRKRSNDRFVLPLDFDIGIKDSSIIRSHFLEYSNHLYLTQTFRFNDDYPHIWSLAFNNGRPVLRIEGIGISSNILSSLFFIDKTHSNRILLHRWVNGKKEYFTLKEQKGSSKKRRKKLALLTSHAWKFKTHSTKKVKKRDELIDLGIAEDHFNELTPPHYHHDTTFIISDSDLIQKQLVLKFNQNHTYEIRRDKRIIDSGQWTDHLNQFIEITSNRIRESDGIVRGYFEILKIRRGKLTLERRFKSRLNGNIYTDKSKTEVYIPIN